VVRVRLRPVTLATAGSLILTGCLLATEHQLSYWKDSETLFSHVIAVTKNNDVAHDNLGSALAKQGFQAEALAQYQEALRINSHNFQAHNNLGNLLSEMGKTDEALAQYREAVELAPKESLVRVNLGVLLVKMGRFDEAINQCEQAARLDPDDPYLYYLMGTALLEQGRDAEAVGRLREALRLDPNDLPTLMVLASVLALDENPQIRNGAEAVALAEKANNLTGGEHPFVLDTLATSYAEVGRFQDAQQIEQRALQLAQSAALGETNAMNQRLELYKSSRPYHETFTNSLLQNLPKN
jgi:tetratricopeptide (TPR) repeat protein